jgi:filamentous hemagglutinin family protein
MPSNFFLSKGNAMRLAPLFVMLAANGIVAAALANPTNPTVVNGSASVSQSGNVLTVTNTNGAIINWGSFSIASGQTTQFNQPSASSRVLNRVLNDPSVIHGTLSSNGQVFLVNPNGILVGPGGRVDTASFVGSTLNIRNEDFLAGHHVFVDGASAHDVINHGVITAQSGGSVYLIGANVANLGRIATPLGETILAAGASVTISGAATPGVEVDITGGAGVSDNLGIIDAEAGRIGLAGGIVHNSGLLDASSVAAAGGRVFLKASQDAYVDGNGRILATGTQGGNVEVLGNRVAVTDNAAIDASGVNSGGQILVGGDSQGNNPAIQNASITYFGPNASLKADATQAGSGGRVIVWANETTRVRGSIAARGGATSGNGGFVWTSGMVTLEANGLRVDTSAPNGAAGTWRLDATDINVTDVYADTGGSAINVGGGSIALGVGGSIIGGGGNITVGGDIAITGGGVITTGGGTITFGRGNIALAGRSPTAPLALTVAILNTQPDTRKLLQRTAGAISLRGGATGPVQHGPLALNPTPAAPNMQAAPAPSAPSGKGSFASTTGGMVDGAVTLRVSLVDASPIVLR